MSITTQQEVEKTIVILCGWVNERFTRTCSEEQREILPSVIQSISGLVEAIKN
ncbi:hypothetical protein [Brevibacillus halotolerans]|uniref:hypothetical protein n=1 Tax=Brevibacillus halotolerans TaxID=1507437 RepID=UPI0015EF3D97|nr:hypothetical protein [Brevibacillus halotolerans]MBA4535143.1 hypothetical protein [Brevibacillus halotolerans]